MSELLEKVARLLKRPGVGAVIELRDLRVMNAGGHLVDATLSKGSWLLIAFVLLVVFLPLPNKAFWSVSNILIMLSVYAVYVLALEVSSRLFSKAYDRHGFRVIRIIVNVVTVSGLIYFSRGTASYFWSLYLLPVLQASIYLHRRGANVVVGAILSSYWLACLASGTADDPTDYTLIAINCLILLLLAVALRILFKAARESRQIEYDILESLRQISLAQVDQESLLRLTIQRAVDLLKAKGGGIYEYDSKQGELTVIADCGGKQSIVGHKLKKGTGMAGRVVETGEAMAVEDYSTWPHRCPDLEPDLFRAVVEVPLVQQEHVIGVLYVTHEEKGRTFTERDKRILCFLANHAATIISNVKAFEESKKNVDQLELLNRISSRISLASTLDEILQVTLREALETVGAKDGSIMVFDPKTGELEIKAWLVDRVFQNAALHKRFSPGTGIAGQVALTLEPYNCRDTDEDTRYVASDTGRRLRSILSVPILSNNNLLCIINADSLEPNRFKDVDVELFSIIASRVAAAIESVKLREVGVSLSSLSVEELYAKIVESAYTLIGADAASLFIKDDDTEEIVRVAAYPPEQEPGGGIARQDGLTRLVLKTGNQVTIPDAQKDERVKPRVKQQGVKTLVGVPLTARLNSGDDSECRTIGVLFASTRKARTFGAREEQILYSLANQAAVAIMQARLYKAVLQERDLLKKSLRFQQSLLASAIDAVIAIDRESNITEFNTSAEKTLGYTREEVLGENVAFLYAREEEARDIMRGLLDVKNKGRLIDYYTNARTKSGEDVPIRLSASLLEDGSVGFFRDQRTVEAIRQHNEYLRGLLAAGRAITELNDLPKILETTVSGAIETLTADLVRLYAYDQQTSSFSPIPLTQESHENSPGSATDLLPNLEGLIAGGDIHFSTAAQDDELVGPDFARGEGLQAVAAGPLKVRDRTVGVMLCGYKAHHHFSDEEQIMVRLFMSDAAIAIETARMYEEMHRDTERLDKLYKISLDLTTEQPSLEAALQMMLDRTCKLIGAEYGALSIISPSGKLQPFIHSGVDEEMARRLPPPTGHGLLGKMLREDEVINERDIKQHQPFTGFEHKEHPDITSFLGRSILVKGKPVGNIYLGNKKGADRFSAEDEYMLGLLASQASSIKQVFDAQKEQGAHLAITNAAILLSQLAREAKVMGGELSGELTLLKAVVPPGPHLETLERVIKMIRELDAPIERIQWEVEKQFTELIVLNKLFYDIARRPDIRSRSTIEIDIPQASLVRGNRLLLEMALGILIKNAIKAVENAGRSGIVLVKCKIANGVVQGTITDTGLGVPEEARPNLFVKPTVSRKGGVSYASYLVGMIMLLHDGYIDVKSTGPTGTTIEFRLPEGRD